MKIKFQALLSISDVLVFGWFVKLWEFKTMERLKSY